MVTIRQRKKKITFTYVKRDLDKIQIHFSQIQEYAVDETVLSKINCHYNT